MASRLKKILHRKSQNLQPDTIHGSTGAVGGSNDPALHATPYDATAPAGLPETGAYPIRGDGSSTARHEDVPSSYNRGHQSARNDLPYSASTSNQFSTVVGNPYSNAAPRTNRVLSGSYNTAHSNAMPTKNRGERDLPSETILSQDLSRLSFADGDARATQAPPRRSLQASDNLDGGSRRYNNTPQEGSPIRVVGGDSMLQSYNAPNAGAYNSNQDTRQRVSGDYHDESDPSRGTSIPRKQVRSSPKSPYSSNNSPTAQYGSGDYDPRVDVEKPLPSAPVSSYPSSQQPGARENMAQPSSVLDRSRPISRSTGGAAYTAREVVERAQHDSADTEVVERIAPAVVHEIVQQQVHHVREEVISREIHDHDIYHRILPVVDVEVLPPRHFLPVEGGGLVEISPSEVPGRGKNWVIAETASKIPSDQPAPPVQSRFTAREFSGIEGDMRRHVSPQGVERTEQTWVHLPELETGGRDSGQTWPMLFGEAVPEKHHRHLSGTSQRAKGHQKSMSKHSATVASNEQPGRAF